MQFFLGESVEARVTEEAIKMGYKVGNTVKYAVTIEPLANSSQG